MRNVTLAVSALLAIAAASYGVGLGLGGYHLVGMPVGDLTVSELTVQGIKLDVDMENGIPFKMGLANFGVGAILNVVPVFGIEGGFEMHTGYKNKEAAVGYEIMGETNEWTEPEDNTTWKMMNLYVGGRANIPTGTLVEPFGGGGLIISINKFEPEDEWLGNKLVSDQYIQATNTGVYFGGGVNFFVARKVAITVPIKYNMLFSGDYAYYVRDAKIGGYTEKWKPPAYLTFGWGVYVYPI